MLLLYFCDTSPVGFDYSEIASVRFPCVVDHTGGEPPTIYEEPDRRYDAYVLRALPCRIHT